MAQYKDLLNILTKIDNFKSFEEYLANLSNDKEKGDLFELFCQVYLKEIYKKQAFKSIQLFKDIDATTLTKLNLRLGKDYGIDIVATTDSGDLWAIQVKFRQSDQLTWTELSTFRAASEKYLIKSRKTESVQHIFMIKDISNYLKNFTNKIKTYETVKPDIVFELNGKEYAIEVETGKVLRSNKKAIVEKVESLNKDYGDNWFFVVTNRNMAYKYSKFGKTYDKRYISTLIKRLVTESGK